MVTHAPRDIRHAYLAKVQQLHPDKYTGAPDEVRQAVTERLAIVHEAGRVLQDLGLSVDQTERSITAQVRRLREHTWCTSPLWEVAD